ncbi:MAG: carbohydrate kinase family protein [Hyphomicrobiales bacterium]|nr:carbohydrate kinase family protein [Hyphomicrobiales bacterium]
MRDRPYGIVAIGSALLEQVVKIDAWPGDGRQGNIRAERVTMSAGGCALNVSAYAARLGIRSAVIAAIGDGRYGAPVLAELEASGVDPRWMKIVRGREGGLLLLLCGPDGAWTALDHTDPQIVLTRDDIPADAFAQTGIVHIDGYSYVTAGDEDAVETAITVARAAGCVISIDSSEPAASTRTDLLRSLFTRADIAFANASEAATVTGSSDPYEAASRLLALGPLAAIIKCGSRGSILATAGGIADIPVFPVDVVDTISAGDAYVAATLAALVVGSSIGDAVLEGSAAGALACRAAGSLASHFTRADIRSAIWTRT